MNEVNLQIKNIILQELKNINQKIKGVSFLEILKFILLDKVINNKSDKQFGLDFVEETIKFDDDKKNIQISLINYKSPKIIINKKIIKETLLICLEGHIKIDLNDFKSKNLSKSFYIKADTGITLPKEMIGNFNYMKGTKLIEILLEDKTIGIEIDKERTI
tara:strand:- start:360 stop:842 length:483 start_codon:yes stop_codon:yes gene_type:complete